MNQMTIENGSDIIVEASKLSFDELAKHASRVAGPDVVDKEELVGKELVVVDIRETEAGTYGPFASFTCKLRDNTLVVFNDGSTGCYKQWKDGEIDSLPLYCRKGLRKSTYPSPTGTGTSTTYYLAR